MGIAVFCDISHAACWNVGILEKWNIGLKIGMGLFFKAKLSVIPVNAVSLIHHSIIPIQWICCGSQTKKILSQNARNLLLSAYAQTDISYK